MKRRQEFISLILSNEYQSCIEFDANPAKILNLFTDASHVTELFRLDAITVNKMVTEGEGRLQQLIITPCQFYELYAINPRLATVFLACAETHFHSVFQRLEDIIDLALLDASCGISMIPETKDHYKDTKVCDSLFKLAVKESPNNLCLLILLFIPMRNISSEDFEALYVLMKNNPSIADNRIEEWKDNYHYENSSLLSSIGFFAVQVAESVAVNTQRAIQYFGYNQ